MSSDLNRSEKGSKINFTQGKYTLSSLLPSIRKRQQQLNQYAPSKSVAIFPQFSFNNISRVSVSNQAQGMWLSSNRFSREYRPQQQKPRMIHSKLNLNTNKNTSTGNYSTPISRNDSPSPLKPSLPDNSNSIFDSESPKVEIKLAEKLRGLNKYTNQPVSGATSLVNSRILSPNKIDFTIFAQNKIKYRPKKVQFSNRHDQLNESDFDEMDQLDHIKHEIKIRRYLNKPNSLTRFVSQKLKCMDELKTINLIPENSITNNNSRGLKPQLTKEEEKKVGILKKKMKISGMFGEKLSNEEKKSIFKKLQLDYHPDKVRHEKQTCEDITTFLIHNKQLFLQSTEVKSIGSVTDFNTKE